MGLILRGLQLFGNVIFSLIEAHHFRLDGIDNIDSWTIVDMVNSFCFPRDHVSLMFTDTVSRRRVFIRRALSLSNVVGEGGHDV